MSICNGLEAHLPKSCEVFLHLESALLCGKLTGLSVHSGTIAER